MWELHIYPNGKRLEDSGNVSFFLRRTGQHHQEEAIRSDFKIEVLHPRGEVGDNDLTCDGIDVHSCSNVRISDCYIDTGDDGICLKSIPDWFVSADGAGTVDYSKPRIPCENVVIENCVVGSASGLAWPELFTGIRR